MRFNFAFDPSKFWSMVILQFSPYYSFEFCQVCSISNFPCHIWILGSFSQGLQWWCPHWVLCNSCGQGVNTWAISNLFLLLTTFPTSVHLKKLFLWAFSNLVPCHLQIFFFKSAPNILSYVMWLNSNCCCTFYVSSSPTLLRLRNRCFTFTLFKFL